MVFKSFAKQRKAALFLGSPEAEGESLPTSKVALKDVYEDHHDLFTELTHEKFILVGRKGCGKSAFAEYANAVAADDANLFCTFIRQDSVSLETLVQLGETAGLEQTKEHLFKWLIYTNILKLFFSNEAVQKDSKHRLLGQFLKKNSGYIDIDKGEVIELVKKHKFEVSIEHFKRFFKGKYNKDVEIKESRAPYYKLLPHLEKVVVDILTSVQNLENENSYVVFFDDLDIGFKSTNPHSVDTLVSLLRTAKHVNNNVFAKNGASAKAVILIRDDVERLLSPMEADVAKIFSSYGVQLNWYQEEYLQNNNEEQLGLKKMINKRARNAFEHSTLDMTKSSPWDSLVADEFGQKSSFKYVADHTFLRPRDLILFFKPLESGGYVVPLSKYNTNNLLGQYASEMVKELSNELSSFYEPNEIQNIFDALKNISEQYNCTYEKSKSILMNYCGDIGIERVLKDLFDRSVIGSVNPSNGFVKFKHKLSKKDAQNYSIDKSHYVIIHVGIKVYLRNR
nr:hypothetical protein [Moritella viscosa]SHO12190.1 Putative uncharacterized protein [Moritella viscosa]